VSPYLLVFLVSAGTVLLITPVVRRFAARLGAIDRPSDRKVHPKPTPTLGGIGIFVGVMVALGVAYFIPDFRRIYRQSFELQGVALGALVITAVGVVDDVRALSAPAKAAGQILAAGLLILTGVELLFFWFPTQGVVSLGSDLAVPLTVAWVLIMVNATNFIDGLDGLAAGIVAIAAGAFFVWVYVAPSTFSESASIAALLAAIAAGAAVGFLPYNFYPARIFMGDSGAMLLGLLLAASTVAGVGRTIQPTRGALAAFAIPVMIPLFVLAVPLVDVGMAIVRRIRKGRPIYAPDKEHIHHQLREIGHTHRRAVLTMYFWSLLLAGAGLAVSFIHDRAMVVLFLVFTVLLIGASFIPRRLRERRRLRSVQKAGTESVQRAGAGPTSG
jgi:UDP-GlcNAc:undecaprenyl-phosphate/decaprenyl-phosphate GlcNAc-1-phosphate transferase